MARDRENPYATWATEAGFTSLQAARIGALMEAAAREANRDGKLAGLREGRRQIASVAMISLITLSLAGVFCYKLIQACTYL